MNANARQVIRIRDLSDKLERHMAQVTPRAILRDSLYDHLTECIY